MERKHYLLLAHDQPDHVGRLVDRLDDGASTFWLHLDARVDEVGWRAVTARPAVTMVHPRIRCVWGTWSMVEAQLAQLRACLAAAEPGYLVMLSGQSYPVRTQAQIDALITAAPEAVRADFWSLTERWPDNHRERLDYFCIPMSETKGDIRLLRPRSQMNARELVGWTRRLRREVGARRAAAVLRTIGRSRPDLRDRVVGGSQWWAMPWHVASRMVEHLDHHPEYEDFFRWGQYPDEGFFQTVLASMDPSLVERPRPSPTHVDWTEGDWDLPRTMGTDDVATLLALPDDVLFARKFLSPRSDRARDAIDAALDREGAS